MSINEIFLIISRTIFSYFFLIIILKIMGKREDLTGDIRLKFMQERVDEYMRVKWTRDVWDEELAFYKDREIVFSEDVWDSLKDVELTKHNAWIMQPILERIKENDKYNFKKYIKQNWNKK